MSMDVWSRFGRARVGRLGTVGVAERPQLVPCCFAVDEGPVAYSAVDDKPKRSSHLQRLANVAAHPIATLLVDHYDEDWTALWWIRATGPARVIDGGSDHDRAIALLLAKYEQYFTHRLDGPVLAIQLDQWRVWSAAR
jgi:PPOX class probable F420-dependent enzyme